MLKRSPIFQTILTCAILIAAIFITPLSRAQGFSQLKIIRDVEIEETLHHWAEPLLKAANLKPESVNIILVQSDQINAFVAGGANIFIFTGLIDKSETPDEVIGVLAHEIGHIAGGHLIHNTSALKRASYESILGTVLGMGAAILAGDGRIGMAVASASQQFAMQNYLSHSRTNESSADQAALSYLKDSQMSADGLLSFFEKLEHQELRPSHQQDAYARTHPITTHRMDAIRKSVHESPHKHKSLPKHWIEQHKRMKAKLTGFIRPDHVAWDYADRDTSFPARYARAISYYRLSQTNQALKAIDALIQEEPQNPYLHELKGQMLTEFGRVKEALPALKKTIAIAPSAGLFHIALAHALIETGDKTNLPKAIRHLKIALHDEKRSSQIHRLLATAYGRSEQNIKAQIHLAEEALLQRQIPFAKRQALAVLKQAPENSPEATQAKDILHTIDKPKD